MARPDHVVNLAAALAKFTEQWSPKIVGQVNDLHVKLAKLQGEFVWHAHPDTDELFLIVSGSLTIELRDRDPVTLHAGEFFVVPRGVEHLPRSEAECEVLLIEPAGTVNTGNAADADGNSERSSTTGEWL
ncbi:MAG: cupin domain-containing protein [Planctomycetota bacterium]|jgi:mannose-6-phosphate isomerase-like protein (cupin superfamily)